MDNREFRDLTPEEQAKIIEEWDAHNSEARARLQQEIANSLELCAFDPHTGVSKSLVADLESVADYKEAVATAPKETEREIEYPLWTGDLNQKEDFHIRVELLAFSVEFRRVPRSNYPLPDYEFRFFMLGRDGCYFQIRVDRYKVDFALSVSEYAARLIREYIQTKDAKPQPTPQSVEIPEEEEECQQCTQTPEQVSREWAEVVKENEEYLESLPAEEQVPKLKAEMAMLEACLKNTQDNYMSLSEIMKTHREQARLTIEGLKKCLSESAPRYHVGQRVECWNPVVQKSFPGKIVEVQRWYVVEMELTAGGKPLTYRYPEQEVHALEEKGGLY